MGEPITDVEAEELLKEADHDGDGWLIATECCCRLLRCCRSCFSAVVGCFSAVTGCVSAMMVLC